METASASSWSVLLYTSTADDSSSSCEFSSVSLSSERKTHNERKRTLLFFFFLFFFPFFEFIAPELQYFVSLVKYFTFRGLNNLPQLQQLHKKRYVNSAWHFEWEVFSCWIGSSVCPVTLASSQSTLQTTSAATTAGPFSLSFSCGFFFKELDTLGSNFANHRIGV